MVYVTVGTIIAYVLYCSIPSIVFVVKLIS